MSLPTDLAAILVSCSAARKFKFYDAVDHTRLKKIGGLLAEPYEIALDLTRRPALILN
jgi:hypothetical protein